ncbi:MAG: phosphate/phosphite/phosphonate ABC transporter substrate-binding protein [Gemmatimonadales bacterium]
MAVLKHTVVALAVLAAACGGDVAADPDPFVLGFLPSQRATELVPRAEVLAAFLSERMGREVSVVVPTAYEPLIEGLRFGHVHAAFLDGGPAWIAHERFGAEVVLAEVNTQGNTFYYAEAFTRADLPVRTPADIVGRRVAFTSRTGSSGFLMPIGSMIADSLLHPAGGTLADLEAALRAGFAATLDAGGYQQALEALLAGRVDVAFGADDAPARFLNDAQRARIRSFHRFGRIPSHAVVVGAGLAPEAIARFRGAMLALNDSANLPLLQSIYGVSGLRVTTTMDHLGDFGRAISALPGMEQTLLSRTP